MSKIRLALFPLSIVYDGITRFKNFLYSSNILSSVKFDIPVIIVGNLSTGGTGKTPHTEFIAKLISPINKTAVLSRGYGRKTTGYVFANKDSIAEEIGDEPLQISRNISNIDVAVCEDRITGINRLMRTQSSEVIILDDAFQHRKVQGSLYILLTTYSKPFYDDKVLPAGDLRETSKNKNRADIIIVTKCPSHISEAKSLEIIKKIKPGLNQRVFFSEVIYDKPKPFFNGFDFEKVKNTILVTGIVQPKPLEKHIISMGKSVQGISFKDHYDYTLDDVKQMASKLFSLPKHSAIITTSKDAVKLQPLVKKLDSSIPIFEIPITISVLFDQENELKQIITDHVKGN